MTVSQLLESTITRWRELEQRYEAHRYDGASEKLSVRLQGNEGSPFVFTAPHAVNHIRERKVKYAERGTGGLAELLALSTDNLAVTVDGPLTYDPNWDQSPQLPFKKTLLSTLTDSQTVVDLHGMKDDYDIDFCIGLGNAPDDKAKSIAENLSAKLVTAGFRVSRDWPFDGRRIGTITNFVQDNGYSGFQVEIAARLRYPNISEEDANLLIDRFTVGLRHNLECS